MNIFILEAATALLKLVLIKESYKKKMKSEPIKTE